LVSDRFFTDEIADLGSKDAAMAMRGVWLIEMSDLETLVHRLIQKVQASV
jgi:hypothetical protein